MAGSGLYAPLFEQDSCGIGFVANMKHNKDHRIVSDALTILENREHPGGWGCENNTGNGTGITIQMSHSFIVDECLKDGVQPVAFGKYGAGVIFFTQIAPLQGS